METVVTVTATVAVDSVRSFLWDEAVLVQVEEAMAAVAVLAAVAVASEAEAQEENFKKFALNQIPYIDFF